MPIPSTDLEMVEEVSKHRKGKNPKSFRNIARIMGRDVKTIYRWYKFSLNPNIIPYKHKKYGEQKESQIKSQSKYRSKNKQKIKARKEIFKLIRNGSLVKKRCIICGKEKSEAHHPDHNKSLKVIWLCKKHHGMEDRKLSTV